MSLPTSGLDLFADEVLLDPYPAYAELRELGRLDDAQTHRAVAAVGCCYGIAGRVGGGGDLPVTVVLKTAIDDEFIARKQGGS